MRFRRRVSIAVFGLTIALACAWNAAFWARAYRTKEPEPGRAVRRAPDAARVDPSAVIRSARAADLAPYVASDRHDSKTYHRRDCPKYMPTMRRVKEYATREEAEADGKRPCHYCLGGLTVLHDPNHQ